MAFHSQNVGKLIAIFLALLVFGVVLLIPVEKIGEQGNQKEFSSERLGLVFSYPENYYLEELELGDGHLGNLVILLTEDTEENRLVREGKSPGREGPVSISFEIFQSPEWLSPIDWAKNQIPFSNFNMSNGEFLELVVGGVPAVEYRWSGLYEGRTLVFSNRDYVVMATATYIAPEDRILKDFQSILDTIVLN